MCNCDEKSSDTSRMTSRAERPMETFQTSSLAKEEQVRKQIARVCQTALPKLPPIEKIESHWNNSSRLLLSQLYRIVREGTKATEDKWDLRQSRYFVTSIDILSEAIDVGWDLGFRDATGVVFQRKGKPGDPHGC